MQPAEYKIMFREEENHWFYSSLRRLLFDTLEKEMPDWRTRKILDAGCGTGAILQRLGHPECNAGVDLADEAIAFCRQRGLLNVQKADISSLPFPDDSFDAVICSSVLYHAWVKDVALALREIRRVLRPGGLFLVNLPAFSFLHSAHDDAVMTARRFSKKEARSLLVNGGFEIRRLTYWIMLLFPLALIARTLGGSKAGRDFSSDGMLNRLTNGLFGGITACELGLLRVVPALPFGVALFGAARKADATPH